MSDATFQNLEVEEQLTLQEDATRKIELMDEDGYMYENYIVEKFKDQPIAVAGVGYGSPTGSTGNTNRLLIGSTVLEYHIKGTQTILMPVLDANGLDIGMDQTDNDGVELTPGITSRSRAAFNVDNDNFFAELKFSIEDVSGSDHFCLGFRKAAAYAADINDYTDAAYRRWNGTEFVIATILNDASTDEVETGLAITDLANEATLRIEVVDGTTTFFYNGVSTGFTNVNFVFDAGEIVIPFIYFLNATDLAGKVLLKEFRAGKLIAR